MTCILLDVLQIPLSEAIKESDNFILKSVDLWDHTKLFFGHTFNHYQIPMLCTYGDWTLTSSVRAYHCLGPGMVVAISVWRNMLYLKRYGFKPHLQPTISFSIIMFCTISWFVPTGTSSEYVTNSYGNYSSSLLKILWSKNVKKINIQNI